MPAAVEIRDSSIHGKGVFANRDIKKDEVVETAHVVLIHEGYDLPEELATLEFPHDEDYYAICLSGVGSYFNHASEPNIHHKAVQVHALTKEFYALRDIKQGEELCFFYHKEFDAFVKGL